MMPILNVSSSGDHLLWDGKHVEGSHSSLRVIGRPHGLMLVANLPEGFRQETVDALLTKVGSLTVVGGAVLANNDLDEVVSLYVNFSNVYSEWKAEVAFKFHLEHWSLPFSVDCFAREIAELQLNIEMPESEWVLVEDDSFTGRLTFITSLDQKATWCSAVELLESKINRDIKQFFDERKSSDKNSQGATYNFYFPEDVATACEQYLLYFGQFLTDMGISATANVARDDQTTIFQIIPADNRTALEQIHDALGTYLRLPGLDIAAINETVPNVALLHLGSQVDHLKSQLKLAQAIIETKNETIRIIRESSYISDSGNTPEKPEHLFGGIITVSSFKIGAAKLNIAEILRKLKRR